MARKKTSPLEDLMDISAQLPWQAGIVLALVAYAVLHYFASGTQMTTSPVELKALGKTMGDSMVHSVGTMLAGIFQYLLPLVFLLGSFVSFKRRRRQRELHQQVCSDPAANALEKISWRDFEGLVAECYRQQGYRVVERGGDGPDGGVDLELYMASDKYLVQCKQWKSSKVGVATVRELYGVMTAERAIGGFVVTSGTFTDDAKAFADGRSIKLVDARKLHEMLGGKLGGSSIQRPAPASVNEVQACPKCGKPMVKRVAKKGSLAGNEFWGCSNYPACRGIRN